MHQIWLELGALQGKQMRHFDVFNIVRGRDGRAYRGGADLGVTDGLLRASARVDGPGRAVYLPGCLVWAFGHFGACGPPG